MVRWKKLTDGWQRMMEGYGFALLTVICVAVITATAVWTGREAATPVIPPLANTQEQQASVLKQQSLQDAVTPSPPPAAQAIHWQAPLEDMRVLRGFSTETMVRSSVTGLWELHAAVDLAAKAGTPVQAMADGQITACGEDTLIGCWVDVTHRDGYVTRYEGMTLLGALRQGDSVKAGQTLGFVGSGMVDETDLGPHLHLEVMQNGAPVDPMPLLK